MPRCYSLVVCIGSSLDQATNSFTLFHLVEEAQAQIVPGSAPVLPFEVHTYWQFAPEEINRTVHMKFALQSDDRRHELPSAQFQSNTVRFRVRSIGLAVPPQSAAYELRVSWRLTAEDEWREEPIFWPLILTIGEVPRPASEAAQ